MLINFLKNTIFISLTLMFLNTLFAQNIENDPFQELEAPARKNNSVQRPSSEPIRKKSGKIILNPLTYLAADEYQLKGIFIGQNDENSFAVVSTDDIQDQVITFGDRLGKEGYIVYHIDKDKIVVGFNNLKSDKDSKSIYLVD